MAALVAEKHDHHPEWRNDNKTVEVVLATHDAGGVTRLDIELGHLRHVNCHRSLHLMLGGDQS